MHQLTLQHTNELAMAWLYKLPSTHSVYTNTHPLQDNHLSVLSLFPSHRNSRPELRTAMARSCSMKQAMAVVTLMCAVVFITEVQACSVNDLAQCLNAVANGATPTAACCAQVAAADVPCVCNLFTGTTYSPTYVNNAVNLPAKCGGAAYAHFQGQVCAGECCLPRHSCHRAKALLSSFCFMF